MWWSLAGAIVCPLLIWGVLSTFGDEYLKSSPVGQTLSLNKTGVVVSKTTLQRLLNTGRASLPILISTGQVLTPPVGTSVKVTYTELFQDMNIYQVLIESGKYKGRSGWVTEQQVNWRAPNQTRKVRLSYSGYELPSGLDKGDVPAGMDGGVAAGGANPDK
jgi:hypothetical protein